MVVVAVVVFVAKSICSGQHIDSLGPRLGGVVASAVPLPSEVCLLGPAYDLLGPRLFGVVACAVPLPSEVCLLGPAYIDLLGPRLFGVVALPCHALPPCCCPPLPPSLPCLLALAFPLRKRECHEMSLELNRFGWFGRLRRRGVGKKK